MQNEIPALKIGIVGLSDQGIVHAEILDELGQELIGVDVSEDARKQFEHQFAATTYENPIALFEAGIDAVVVTTPNKFHERPAVTALERGLDVFVEKPIANNLESAHQIRAAARDSDGFCMVGFHHRFLAGCSILKEYIEDGYFGDIYHIQANHIRRRGIPGRGTWFTSNDIAGGGALLDIGIHVIDLLFYFLETTEFEDVMGITRTNFGHREDYAYTEMHGEEGKPHLFDVEDSATALLQSTDGQTASIEVAWAANGEPRHEYYLYGTEAGAYLDLTNANMGRTTATDGRGEETFQVFEARKRGIDHFFDGEIVSNTEPAFRMQFETFLNAVDSNEAPGINTVEQAYQVQKVADDIYSSSGLGRP